MPSGLIDEEDGVRARIDGGADFFEMSVHRVRVAPRQDEARALAFRGTGRAEDVGPLRALIARRTGPRPAFGPTPRQFVLLPDAGLVLEPELDLDARAETRADLFQLGGEVFLKAATANSFCA